MALAVPYAINGRGELADPARALPEGPFRCLECRAPVSFRREHLRGGHRVKAHFAHASGSECSGESVLHLAARLRLREALSLPESEFYILQVCQRHRCEDSQLDLWQPPIYDTAEEEVTLGGYRLDVALLHGDRVVFGFEVFHTHRIGSVKGARLPVPWMELDANATASNPYLLTPVIDPLIRGEDEEDLCFELMTNRAGLGEALTRRLAVPAPLDVPIPEGQVPAGLVQRVFSAKREGTSFLGAYRCEPCEGARLQHEALSRERDRKALEHAARIRRLEADTLANQRTVLGSDLALSAALPGPGARSARLACQIRFWRIHLHRPPLCALP